MALICATVAAGFVVEQIGVPQIDVDGNGKESCVLYDNKRAFLIRPLVN
jgi:hypothetical protein